MRSSVEKQQLDQNTSDIKDIKTSIETIKNNHLFHIEKDMEKQSKTIEKMDNRLFWILGLLVVGIIIPAFIQSVGL